MLEKSVVEKCCSDMLERSGEEPWRRELRSVEECFREKCCKDVSEKGVVEKCCGKLWRRVLEKRVVEKRGRRVWRKECWRRAPQGRWLQRFAVVVELTLRWNRCWMRCALESTSFEVKNMQRIQNRSTCLICIRVRGLLRLQMLAKC